MNLLDFLWFVQRESVIEIVDIDEAINYVQETTYPGMLHLEETHRILADLDWTGYIIYAGFDELEEVWPEVEFVEL